MGHETLDPYEILGVRRTASAAEIKQAWRDLQKKHHPDRNPDDPYATARAQAINHAYEILGDDNRRAAYNTRPSGSTAGSQSGPTYTQTADARDVEQQLKDLEDLFQRAAQGFGGYGSYGYGRGRKRDHWFWADMDQEQRSSVKWNWVVALTAGAFIIGYQAIRAQFAENNVGSPPPRHASAPVDTAFQENTTPYESPVDTAAQKLTP